MAQPNPYTGDVPIELGGQTYLLRYDWHALAVVKTTLGEDMGAIIAGHDLAKLAALLAIGLQRHHPAAFTAEAIFALSPPIVPVTHAAGLALNLAWHGPGEAAKENPPKRTARLARALRRMMGKRPAIGSPTD